MKKILIIFTIILTAQVMAYAARVDIQSKHQVIHVDKNKGYFTDNVQVQIGDVIVKSPKAELDLDPSTKKPSIATFLANPYAFQEKGNKKHEIKAQIIRVSLIKKTLFAVGNSQSIIMQDRQPLIVVTAESQEYDTNTSVMKATGGVVINYDDIETFSDFAESIIDNKGDIKDLKLIGHVVMKQKGNVVKGNKFNFDSSRNTFTVVGNTSSDVVFEDGTRVFVTADRQQFDNASHTMIASGHTKILYKDYVTTGPKAQLLVDPKTNKPNLIVFSGRSKIVQNDSTIEADRIELTLKPKGFRADGNVKTSIVTTDDSDLELMK